MRERQNKPVIRDSLVAVAPTATTVGALLILRLYPKTLRFFMLFSLLRPSIRQIHLVDNGYHFANGLVNPDIALFHDLSVKDGERMSLEWELYLQQLEGECSRNP